MQTGHKPVATAEPQSSVRVSCAALWIFSKTVLICLALPRRSCSKRDLASEVASPRVVELRLAFVFTGDAEVA